MANISHDLARKLCTHMPSACGTLPLKRMVIWADIPLPSPEQNGKGALDGKNTVGSNFRLTERDASDGVQGCCDFHHGAPQPSLD